jgi:hypothetical protein
VYSELECYGGPLDGQVVRIHPGQAEVTIAFSTRPADGVRRFAVYAVQRKAGPRRSSTGHITPPVYVLVFTGEEWRVA